MTEKNGDKNETSSKARIKVDLQYLLEKYGPQKKKVPKPVEQEPEYCEKGFSVQFKLSQAFNALEKQEQTVARPQLEEKPKLSTRSVKKLAKASAKVTPQPVIEKKCVSAEKIRGAEVDLEKYKRIGQQKRQRCELTARSVRQQQNEEYLGDNDLQIKRKQQRPVPLQFWTSLSSRKGREKDTVLSEQPEYEDKTFITNINVNSMANSKYPNKIRKHKKSSKKNVSFSNETQSKNICKGNVNSTRGNKVLCGTKAVQEWEKRKNTRRQKKLDQKIKIRQSQFPRNKQESSKQNSVQFQSKNMVAATSDSESPLNQKRGKKLRPKSADKAGILSTLFPSNNIVYPQSKWARSLGSAYLDVPDRFEESLVKISVQSKEDLGESGDEVVKGEADLQYRPSKYLYDMCHCQRVSKLRTLKKLETSTNPAGVIEIYGCTENSDNFSCPFCSVFPNKRIQAWMKDVEQHMAH